MSKNRFYIVLIIGLLISNLLLVFLMVSKGKGRRAEVRSPKEVIIQRLEFNQDQQEEYNKLVDIHRSAAEGLKEEVRALKKQLYAQLSQERNAKINDSLMTRISTKHSQLEKLNIDHFYGIKKICNTNQLEKFNDLTKDLNKLFHRRPPKGRRGRKRN